MSAKREKIRESQLQGFKYFKANSAILQNLHDAGCARDRAGEETGETGDKLYFTGMADEEELRAHIARLQKQE